MPRPAKRPKVQRSTRDPGVPKHKQLQLTIQNKSVKIYKEQTHRQKRENLASVWQ